MAEKHDEVKVSVVVPAYNEEGNIPALASSLIDYLSSMGWDYELIIVNDHSVDGTPKLIDELALKNKRIVAVHRNNGGRGIGFTLREGTSRASGDVIIWTMADRCDSLDTFRLMVDKIKEGYDLVIASRYINGGSIGDLPKLRAFVGWFYSFVTRLIFPGLGVRDVSNAFRCFRKKVFDTIVLESGDFALSPEIAVKAYRAGFRIGEVPTSYTTRKVGKSSFKLLKMGVRYGSIFKYRIFPRSSFMKNA